MDKQWRPDKWECPYKPDGDKDELYCDIGARDGNIFEAGADAMLEALEETAVCDIVVKDSESIRINIGDLGKDGWQNGVWYFIPR